MEINHTEQLGKYQQRLRKQPNINREHPFEVVLKRVIVAGNKDITQLVKELEKIYIERKSDDDLNKLPL